MEDGNWDKLLEEYEVIEKNKNEELKKEYPYLKELYDLYLNKIFENENEKAVFNKLNEITSYVEKIIERNFDKKRRDILEKWLFVNDLEMEYLMEKSFIFGFVLHSNLDKECLKINKLDL